MDRFLITVGRLTCQPRVSDEPVRQQDIEQCDASCDVNWIRIRKCSNDLAKVSSKVVREEQPLRDLWRCLLSALPPEVRQADGIGGCDTNYLGSTSSKSTGEMTCEPGGVQTHDRRQVGRWAGGGASGCT